jgi:serine/threonine protein kinase
VEVTDDRFPRLLGRYVLLRRIAEHRAAGVYLAAGGETGKEAFYAVKVRRRLEGELVAIEFFRHDNVVALIDAGRAGEYAYLAMELLDGNDLLALWNRCAERRVAIPLGMACALVMDLLAALSHIHATGNTYGMICPAKVMLTFDGRVKLLDFQLVRTFVGSTPASVKRVIGRPGYLSPEQIRGEATTAASDIYAVGVILWELLVGRPLFARRGWGGSSSDVLQYCESATAGAPCTRPSAVRKRVPGELDAIVERALAQSPSERYTSAEEFRSVLSQVVTHLPHVRGSLGPFVQSLFEAEIFDQRRKQGVLLSAGRILLEEVPARVRKLPVPKAAPVPTAVAPQPKESASERGRRKDNPRSVAGWVGGSAALVALVAGGALFWNHRRTAADAHVVSARAESTALVEAKVALRPPAIPAAEPSRGPVRVDVPHGTPPVTAEANVAPASARIAASTTTVPNRKTSHRSVDKAKPPLDATSAQKVVALILLGDTYVRIGDADQDSRKKADAYHGAIAQYDDALKVNPGAESALAGRELARKRLSRITTATRSLSPNDLPIPSD